MNAIDWLLKNAPGFRDLSGDERDAIMQFSLLWSLFEAKALKTHSNADSILAVAKQWANKGLLADESFNPERTYFQNCYYADGDFTYHFDHLNLRRAVRPWMKPWDAAHAAGPVSKPLRHNGQPYSGINILMLWASAMERGYSAPIWMTFRQARDLGAHVRKGEKGALVVYAPESILLATGFVLWDT